MQKKHIIPGLEYAISYGNRGRCPGSPRLARATVHGFNGRDAIVSRGEGGRFTTTLANVVCPWSEHETLLGDAEAEKARLRARHIEVGARIRALAGDRVPFWVGRVSGDGSYASTGGNVDQDMLLAMLEAAYAAGKADASSAPDRLTLKG